LVTYIRPSKNGCGGGDGGSGGLGWGGRGLRTRDYSLLAAGFFSKGHLDESLVIANAKGRYCGGRVGKKAGQGWYGRAGKKARREKTVCRIFLTFQTLRQPNNGVPDWSICARRQIVDRRVNKAS